MSFGKDLVKLAVTKTRLDQVLFEEGGDGILRGSLVPQFLEKVGEHPEIFAELRSTPPLQELAVVAGAASPELRVSGGQDAIRVDPGLACTLPDGTVLRRSHAIVAALPAGRAFLRYGGGWAECWHMPRFPVVKVVAAGVRGAGHEDTNGSMLIPLLPAPEPW